MYKKKKVLKSLKTINHIFSFLDNACPFFFLIFLVRQVNMKHIIQKNVELLCRFFLLIKHIKMKLIIQQNKILI